MDESRPVVLVSEAGESSPRSSGGRFPPADRWAHRRHGAFPSEPRGSFSRSHWSLVRNCPAAHRRLPAVPPWWTRRGALLEQGSGPFHGHLEPQQLVLSFFGPLLSSSELFGGLLDLGLLGVLHLADHLLVLLELFHPLTQVLRL